MATEKIRTSVDLSRDLHRRLREAAERKACSARKQILTCIERAVEESARPQRRRWLKLDPPIVPSTGKPFGLTNKQIHELIEFP